MCTKCKHFIQTIIDNKILKSTHTIWTFSFLPTIQCKHEPRRVQMILQSVPISKNAGCRATASNQYIDIQRFKSLTSASSNDE